jgi:hypothetical protein
MKIRVDERRLENSKAKRTRRRKIMNLKEKSFDELVKEQDVKAIVDFSKISGGWEDVDIDAFIKEVRGPTG